MKVFLAALTSMFFTHYHTLQEKNCPFVMWVEVKRLTELLDQILGLVIVPVILNDYQYTKKTFCFIIISSSSSIIIKKSHCVRVQNLVM